MVVLVDEEGSHSKRRFRPAPPVSQVIGGKEYDPKAIVDEIVDGDGERPGSSLAGRSRVARETSAFNGFGDTGTDDSFQIR